MEDVKTAFKKFKPIVFYLLPKGFFMCWGKEEATPYNKIHAGFYKAPHPRYTFKVSEVGRIECTVKPGLFRKGILSLYKPDGNILIDFEFKDKASLNQ